MLVSCVIPTCQLPSYRSRPRYHTIYQTVGSWVRRMGASFAEALGMEPGDPHEATPCNVRY